MENSKRGQSLLEFALILPLLFLLIINVVNFGVYYYAAITVSNAARTGADYLMRGPATIGSPAFATAQDISDIIKGYTVTAGNCKDGTAPSGTYCSGDISSLPNRQTANVTICTNNNGHIQAPGTCLATVTDPQAATSVVAQVTVAYTYDPPIPFWDFPGLGIHTTLPSNMTIRRTATTRLMQ